MEMSSRFIRVMKSESVELFSITGHCAHRISQSGSCGTQRVNMGIQFEPNWFEEDHPVPELLNWTAPVPPAKSLALRISEIEKKQTIPFDFCSRHTRISLSSSGSSIDPGMSRNDPAADADTHDAADLSPDLYEGHDAQLVRALRHGCQTGARWMRRLTALFVSKPFILVDSDAPLVMR
jgi:hypothetical protein